jgi:hypothetical protein
MREIRIARSRRLRIAAHPAVAASDCMAHLRLPDVARWINAIAVSINHRRRSGLAMKENGKARETALYQG